MVPTRSVAPKREYQKVGFGEMFTVANFEKLPYFKGEAGKGW